MSFIRDVYDIGTELYRKYAAAKNSPTLGPRPYGTGNTVNDEIEVSWDTVTARQSQLIRDFPLFAGAVDSMEAFYVGDGIKPQWNVLNSRGKPDKETSQKIEDHFMKWANDPNLCDTAGKLSFWEQQRLAVRMNAEFGEYLFLKSLTPKGFHLSAIEPTLLADPGFHTIKVDQKNGTQTWRGIEYNTNSMRVSKYHFRRNPDANSFTFDYITVPSDRIIHGFKHLRPGQLRGITPFASAILLAGMLQDYMQSEVTSQNLASRYMAFVTAPPSGVHSAHKQVEYKSEYNKYVQAMDYATINYLKNGEQVTVNTQTRQANAFKNFNEIIIKYVATTTKLPYEILSGDYSGLNFTTLRGVRNDFKQHLRKEWQSLINHFCEPVINEWLRAEVMSGRLSLPGYFTNPERFQRMRWITPALEQVDPLKEFNAELLKVNSAMKSPQTVIKGMGDDPDRVLQEIIDWQERLKEGGIDAPGLSSNQVPISNWEIIEEPEEEIEETIVEEDTDRSEYARDTFGNIYRSTEDGSWEKITDK